MLGVWSLLLLSKICLQAEKLLVQDVEMDRERLTEKNKSVEYRCLRFATVRDNWPELLRAYERKRAEAADKAAKKEARKYGSVLHFYCTARHTRSHSPRIAISRRGSYSERGKVWYSENAA